VAPALEWGKRNERIGGAVALAPFGCRAHACRPTSWVLIGIGKRVSASSRFEVSSTTNHQAIGIAEPCVHGQHVFHRRYERAVGLRRNDRMTQQVVSSFFRALFAFLSETVRILWAVASDPGPLAATWRKNNLIAAGRAFVHYESGSCSPSSSPGRRGRRERKNGITIESSLLRMPVVANSKTVARSRAPFVSSHANRGRGCANRLAATRRDCRRRDGRRRASSPPAEAAIMW